MRRNGRWWIIIMAAALAGGSWWLLEPRRPRPAGIPMQSAEPVAVVKRAEADPNKAPPDPGPLPPVPIEDRSSIDSAFTPVAGSVPDGPPGPDDDGDASPSPPLEFEGLPAIVDQVELASRSIELAPEVSAALQRGERAQAEGRLADAEAAFGDAAQRPGDVGREGRRKLAEVYWLEGRFDEVRSLAETIRRDDERVAAFVEAREMLQFALAMGLNPLPVDRMQAALTRNLDLAPRDDRTWLGLGNLALRRGRLDEAASWLDACVRRRPRDHAVWHARLEWAMAAGRVDAAIEAARHLPASIATTARVETIRAWFAARRGDRDAERSALERASAADPGNVDAIERLAAIATRDGRTEDATRLRRQKADLDRTLHRFRTLFRTGELDRDAAELARLSETLGRHSMASGLWMLVKHEHPDDPEATTAITRLDHVEARPTAPDGTLANWLGLDADVASASKAAPTTAHAPRVVPSFRDNARAAGLRFVFESGATDRRQLPETMSGGVGLLDYDGDGFLDVYLVQGGTFPPSASSRPFGDRLFRNRGDGTFEDVTRSAGLSRFEGGYGHGVTVGDYDNDGHPDLFVTRWRSYALYRNRGDGTFEDATAAAGLGGDRDWPTSSAFADLDGDGDLDLYVCHYLAWDAEHPEICRSPANSRIAACDPSRFAALPDHLFRNDGGRFVDVSKEAGIDDHNGRGLGVIADDLDNDGRLDLFVANDGTANFLFLNRGEMRFEESADASGVAAAGSGGYRAGMGVARGDLDGDGQLDLAVTNFFGESTTFYQCLGGGLFTDRTAAIGLAGPSRYRLGFGIAFLDADDDGRLDLLTVNGPIADERPEIPYAMPAQLMLGMPDGRLADASAAAGAPFQVDRIGRGLAVGDLDNDGRLDAVVIGHDAPVACFHNDGPAGHSITIGLEGTTSHRDAIGARVIVEAGGRRQTASRFGGGSYQSSGDPRLHFGLGKAAQADLVEVRWPSGRVDRHHALKADTVYRFREGDPIPKPAPWASRQQKAGS